ncbi:MAG: diacylglycerol kinase family protein [Planctomycetota bacterium]
MSTDHPTSLATSGPDLPRADAGCVREVWVVVSPKSGSGQGRDRVQLLQQRLIEAGVECTINDSIDQLQQRLAGVDRQQIPSELVIVAAGGDGTLALVAEHTPSCVPIVPLPMGTENLVARHFEHSPLPESALETILNGTDMVLDAGRANGRLFLVMASAGFDAEVVRAVHLRRRGFITRFTYIGPIVRAIQRYKFGKIRVTVESDDSPEPTTVVARWAMAFNLPCYARSLAIEPDAIGDDGRLDVITLRYGSLLSGLRYLFGILTRQHLRYRDVVRKRGQRIRFESDKRVPYQLDGDYCGRLPLQIETVPARVRIRLPR